jgi:hypothetical protein
VESKRPTRLVPRTCTESMQAGAVHLLQPVFMMQTARIEVTTILGNRMTVRLNLCFRRTPIRRFLGQPGMRASPVVVRRPALRIWRTCSSLNGIMKSRRALPISQQGSASIAPLGAQDRSHGYAAYGRLPFLPTAFSRGYGLTPLTGLLVSSRLPRPDRR